VVEYVDASGTVTFFHRAGHGVERGVLTLDRPDAWRDAGGHPLNSPLRARGGQPEDAPTLAAQLFVGFGRIDPGRLPAGLR
jgi:hypothetical protein